MKTETFFICEHYKRPILPRTGFIIQGNIYVVDKVVTDRPGIIGNNIPELSHKALDFDGETNLLDVVNEVAYHADCLTEILTEAL